jgi:molybdate transport system ATP-binding protein
VQLGRPEFDVDVKLRLEGSTALIGPSGSGKSSVIRALAGLESGASGSFPEFEVGYLGQRDGLFPHMTALDNVAYPLRADGHRKQFARESARRSLEILGLGGAIDQRPGELSGGQRRRVALARALAPKRELYLLDEPFAGLDLDSATLAEKFIAERTKFSDVPYVIAGHDLPRLRRICSSVLRIERGRVAPAGHAVSGSAEPLCVRARARALQSSGDMPADCREGSR